MKLELHASESKIRLADNELLRVTMPSGKVITLESFADPDDESIMVECVTASHKGNPADAKLNGYLWANLRKTK